MSRPSTFTTPSSRVAVSGIYLHQQHSGQQRYAHGIVSRLDPALIDVIEPRRVEVNSSLRRHAWTNARYLSTRAHTALFLTHQYPWYRSRAETEIITVHDVFPVTHPEWYSRSYAAYAAGLLRRGIGRCDVVIAVSDVTADEISANFTTRAEIRVIANAPDDRFFAPARPGDHAVLQRYGLRARQYFVTLASQDPRKRLDIILAAHVRSDARDLPMVVAGSTPAIINASPARAGSAGSIVTGWIDDDDLAALFRHARAFVSASDAEGFGLPAVEAATAGSPVIATDLPVHRWTLGAYARFFEPGSVDSLMTAFNEALQHPPTVAFERRFSFDHSARAVEELLRATHA